MKHYNKLRLSLTIFFSSLAFIIVLLYILGTVLTVKLQNEMIIISVLIGSLVLIPLCVLLFNKLIFGPMREKAILETFNSLEHDNLLYTRKKEVSYEALDALSMANLANEFYISSVIDGTYKGVELCSYFLEYTKDNKRKNEILSRFYIFRFDKPINKIYNRSNFNSRLLRSERVKVKTIDNTLYMVYSNKKKDFKYHMEPLAFKTYDEFKNRFNEELNLIDNVIEVVEKDLK